MKPTRKQKHALGMIADGADVFDYGTAKTLREVEREHPELLHITKPAGHYPGAGRTPYFGAILSPLGYLACKLPIPKAAP
jgi:hypothetical protein